jgi:hypothetical protein
MPLRLPLVSLSLATVHAGATAAVTYLRAHAVLAPGFSEDHILQRFRYELQPATSPPSASDTHPTMSATTLQQTLVGVAAILVMAVIALVGAFLYDLMARWHHWARFWSCQAKIRRVHENCKNERGELLVCPYCVECLPDSRSSKKVMFLCGHQFHVGCSKKWLHEHQEATTRCPVCSDTCDAASVLRKAAAAAATAVVADASIHSGAGGQELPATVVTPVPVPLPQSVLVECSVDGAIAFILRSLHSQYPDIISEACAGRWVQCHTEIWLSELRCPRYSSILRRLKG